jgi:hypothetical protein
MTEIKLLLRGIIGQKRGKAKIGAMQPRPRTKAYNDFKMSIFVRKPQPLHLFGLHLAIKKIC